MPAPHADLPEDVEVQLSRLVAQASQQVLAQSKGQAAQQQAQQQAQDPLIQMQQAELQIKDRDSQTKAQKVQGDLAVKQAEIQLKAQEIANRSGEDPALSAAKIEQDRRHFRHRLDARLLIIRQQRLAGLLDTRLFLGWRLMRAIRKSGNINSKD
jgi:hypothetical protein